MMRYSLSGVRLDMSSSTDAPRSLDDIDLLDHTRLRPILGYFQLKNLNQTRVTTLDFNRHVDLDIGTLHLTLAEPLWHRHECRPQTENYRPSKHFARYEASLGTLKPFRSRASASKYVNKGINSSFNHSRGR